MPHILVRGLLLALPALLLRCAAEAESDGSCSLKCGKTAVGAQEFIIKPVTNSIPVACANPIDATSKAEVPTFFTVPVRFAIMEDVNALKGSTADTAPVSEPTDGVRARMPQYVPRANIAFSPQIFGDVGTPAYTNSEDELCSDSCGIATVNVQAKCVSGGAINVGILSGAGNLSAASAPGTVAITINKR